MNSFVIDAARSGSTQFGYDATESSGRRAPPKIRVKHEDAEATERKRRVLSASGWDAVRNFTIAAWAIRKHLDFVSTFRFQSKTPDAAFNSELERYVESIQTKEAFDVAGRHPYRRALRLAEACRCVDGDVFWLKLAGRKRGKVQPIEGNRVETPRDRDIDRQEWVNGVRLGSDGRPLAYGVGERTTLGRANNWRTINARNMIPHAFYMRYDQVRGVSPVAAGLNGFRDTYEGFEYALAKTKVAQLFGLSYFRDAADDGGPFGSGSSIPTVDTDGDGADDSGYEVNFHKGPFQLDMAPGDRAEILESKTPATETVNFLKLMVHTAIKSLDIPFSFFDESFTNFYGSRGGLIQYQKSCRDKISDLQDLQNAWLRWRLGLAVIDGDLTLPSGMEFADLHWMFVPAGTPWWDPVKEVRGAAMSVAAGFSSPQRICREVGTDFEENIREIRDAMQMAEQAGVPLTFADSSAFSPSIEVTADE